MISDTKNGRIGTGGRAVRVVGPRRASASAAATALGLVSTVLSLLGSWIPSLWGDEATSVLSAERPLPSLFWMLGRVDAVHGTYYLLMHFWVGAFGPSPFAMRVPSAIAAGLTVAGLVLLATRLVSLRTGTFAGLVCLALPRITYMGEEARGYALSAAVAVWLTYWLVGLLQNPTSSRRRWLLYALGVAFSAYIFLFGLLLLPAHAITVLAMRNRGLALRWVRWTALGLVLALPIIGFGFFQRSQIAFLKDRMAATFSSVFVGQWFGNPLAAIVCWALVIAAIGVALAQWRRGRKPHIVGVARRPDIALLATAWLVAPAAILLTVNFVDPIYSNRYLTFAAPAAALLIGYLLARMRPITIPIVLTIAIVATSFSSYQSQRTPYAKNGSDWAAVAAVIHANAKPGDGMMFDETINPSKRPRLGMRTYPYAYQGLKDISLKTVWWKTDYWSDATWPISQLPQHVGSITTIWLTEYRAAGSHHVDTYGRTELASLRFSVTRTFKNHSSVTYELQRR